MMYLDCYMSERMENDEFPEATYELPECDYDFVIKCALLYFQRVDICQRTRGQSPQPVPRCWVRSVNNGRAK